IPSGEETSAGLDVDDRSTRRLVVGIDGRVAEDAAARTAGCAWCRGRIALLLDNDTGAGTIAEEVRFPLRVDGGPLGRRVGDDFGFHQVDMRTDGGIAEGLGAPGIEGATAGRCDVVGYREMGCVIVCLEQYRDGRLAVATPVADHGDSATVDSRVAEDAGEEIASGDSHVDIPAAPSEHHHATAVAPAVVQSFGPVEEDCAGQTSEIDRGNLVHVDSASAVTGGVV